MSRWAWTLVWALVVLACVAAGAGGQRTQRHPAKRHVRRAPARPRRTKAQTRALDRRLEATRRKRSLLRGKLRATKRQAVAAAGDLDAVDARLGGVASRLRSTASALESYRRRQRALSGELGRAQGRLAEDVEAVRRRLRGMYEEGDAPLVSVVLGAASSGDVASRAYLVERIARADRNALDALKASRNRIVDAKQEADEVVTKIAGLVVAQRGQRDELTAARRDKAGILRSLRAQAGQYQEMLDQVEAEEAAISRQLLAAQGGVVASPHFSGRFRRPVTGPITSGFGMRFHPILHRYLLHAGIDFGARTGTPIYAAAAGVVVNATYMRGLGNAVFINHGGGIATVYGHCSRLLVVRGERVTAGMHIADVGSTGLATGPHLHFEVRVNGKPVDPRRWL